MKKIIIATLTLFLTLPAIGAYNTVGPTDEITWPFESVKNTLEGSSLSADEKKLFAYGLKNILETQKTLTFSVTDFIGICLNAFSTLYEESYKNNGDLYAKKCSDISTKLVDEYNKIQQQNASISDSKSQYENTDDEQIKKINNCKYEISSKKLTEIDNAANEKYNKALKEGKRNELNMIRDDEEYRQNTLIAYKYCGNEKFEFKRNYLNNVKIGVLTCLDCIQK